MWTLLLALSALAAPVTFQVNDALVKDRPVEGVRVRAQAGGEPMDLGSTDPSGVLVADLAPGTWQIAYGKAGYVPIPASATVIPPEGSTITSALSPLLEATGDVGHTRVQIVLTWGSEWSDARDLDAHLVCGPDGTEVYFAERDHELPSHEMRLDVDDMDWGGPETITLVDPPPGRHEYFVRNYSGGASTLGTSDVIVRVVFGDEPVGEFRPLADAESQDWLPFAALVVEADGRPRIEPFSADALARGDDRRTGWGFARAGGCDTACLGGFLCPIGGLVIFMFAASWGRLARRWFK